MEIQVNTVLLAGLIFSLVVLAIYVSSASYWRGKYEECRSEFDNQGGWEDEARWWRKHFKKTVRRLDLKDDQPADLKEEHF